MGANAERVTQSEAVTKAVTQAQQQWSQDAKQIQQAQSTRAVSARVIERDSAATLSELDRLRDALRASAEAASTADAQSARAATIGELLQTCSREYQGVARSADGHVADLKMITEAWPK